MRTYFLYLINCSQYSYYSHSDNNKHSGMRKVKLGHGHLDPHCPHPDMVDLTDTRINNIHILRNKDKVKEQKLIICLLMQEPRLSAEAELLDVQRRQKGQLATVTRTSIKMMVNNGNETYFKLFALQLQQEHGNSRKSKI